MVSERKRIRVNGPGLAGGDGPVASGSFPGSGRDDECCDQNQAGRRDTAAARTPVETPPTETSPENQAGNNPAEFVEMAEEVPAGGIEVEAEVPGADPLQLALVERDAYLDSLMRLKAEFDNYRKRMLRELAETRARTRMEIMKEFLPVLDNLGRALDAAEHHEEGKVLDGVRLTHSLFQNLLQREGIREINPLGEEFDPHSQEAMFSRSSKEKEGTVVEVLERGYTAEDRILRPARVVVSSGPPPDG